MYNNSNCNCQVCGCVVTIVGILAAAAGGLLYAFVSLPELVYAVLAMLVISALTLFFIGLIASFLCCCGRSCCMTSCAKAIPITASGATALFAFLLSRDLTGTGGSVNVLDAILFALAFGMFIAMILALAWWMVTIISRMTRHGAQSCCHREGACSNG